MSTATVERPDVERALWTFTGYKGDATAIDGLLTIIDAYALGQAQAMAESAPAVVTAHVHTLVTLAEQLLDTGGRMKLVTSTPAPPQARVTQAPQKPGTYLNADGTLTCRVCGEAKPPECFSRDAGMKTGRKSRCKDCDRGARR